MCKGIVICPGAAISNKDRQRVEQAGGAGARIEFEACSFGTWEDKIWAAWVRPVDPNVTVQTEGEAMVVLAVKGEGRPQDAKNITQWAALENFPRFNTTVGELSYFDVVEKFQYQYNHGKPFNKKDGGKHHNDAKHGGHGGHGNGRFAHNSGRGRGRGRGGFRGRGGRVEK